MQFGQLRAGGRVQVNGRWLPLGRRWRRLRGHCQRRGFCTYWRRVECHVSKVGEHGTLHAACPTLFSARGLPRT
eukprot:11182192-Lingulodinium_polyedra.AAC.1